jgi:hypothetical protein
MYVCVKRAQTEDSFGFGMPLDKRICAYINSKMPTCVVMGIFGKSGCVNTSGCLLVRLLRRRIRRRRTSSIVAVTHTERVTATCDTLLPSVAPRPSAKAQRQTMPCATAK